MPNDKIFWGEDLERDCKELQRLESYGIYPHGHHDNNCMFCFEKK